MMPKRMLRRFGLSLLVVVFCASRLSTAQQGGKTTFVYDDNGRLYAVISPNGEAAIYDYDAAGNMISISRLAADSRAILSFSPHEGLPGDLVTFIGVGIGNGDTAVSFNASAVVVSIAPSKVIAVVPPAATTGLVTITTTNGSTTTSTPFTVAGVRISPTSASLKFGESVLFTTVVLPPMLDPGLLWSVDGIDGGNLNVGTISTTGFYTATNARFSSLTIRATVPNSARVAEAQIRVNDPNDIQSVFAAAVSAMREDPLSIAPTAAPVAAQYDTDRGLKTALSSPVSVRRPDTIGIVGLSDPVSIQYTNTQIQYGARTSVSSTKGPYIQSLLPSSIARGATITLTINGVGLTGTNMLRFVNSANGAVDPALEVSNISASNDGTSLTASVTVNPATTLGSHIIVVVTPSGDSIGIDLGINTVVVVP